MSDFLDQLEHELMRVAERRALPVTVSSGPRGARSWARLADLRAIASGGMVAATVGVVAVVLAVMAVSGVHRAAVRGRSTWPPNSGPTAAAHGRTCRSIAAGPQLRWRAAAAPPQSSLSDLLSGGSRIAGSARRAALRDLDQTVAQATSVYVRDIRVVYLAHGTQVTLVGAQACATVGLAGGVPRSSAPQPSVLAEIRSVHGIATIPLGTVAQIRSGAVFRDRALMLRSRSGPESVTMVPADVVRVVCHDLAGGATTRQFPVADHLAVVWGVSAHSHCDLVHSTASDA